MSDPTIRQTLNATWDAQDRPRQENPPWAAAPLVALAAGSPLAPADPQVIYRMAHALKEATQPIFGDVKAYLQNWQPSFDDPLTRFALALTPLGGFLDTIDSARDLYHAAKQGDWAGVARGSVDLPLAAMGMIPGGGLGAKAVRHGIHAVEKRGLEELAQLHKAAETDGVELRGLLPGNTTFDRMKVMNGGADVPTLWHAPRKGEPDLHRMDKSTSFGKEQAYVEEKYKGGKERAEPYYVTDRPTLVADDAYVDPWVYDSIKRAVRELKDKRLAQQLEYEGPRMSGARLLELLKQSNRSIDEILPKAGFQALDTGNEVRLFASNKNPALGVRHQQAPANLAHKDSPNVWASLPPMLFPLGLGAGLAYGTFTTPRDSEDIAQGSR